MLAAIIKWTKKHKSWIFALSVMVVFCTAYVLIMPAQTLEQEEAEQQGGIDLPTAEQSVDAPDESVSEEPQDEEIASDSGDKPDSVKADLAFEGDGFSITAKAESNAKLPEDTTLTATEVTPDAEDYDAWYEKAEQALKDSPLVKDGATLKSAKFYDITLQADGKEVEPAADVNVKISYDESLKMSRSGDVYVVHFGATANGEVEDEVLKDSSVDVNSKNSAKAGTVEVSDISFDAPGFSMYGVLETTTLEENVVTADGKNYKVSVTYDSDAKVPEGAKLAVSEIETDSDAYKDYVSKSEEALGMDEGTAGYVRLFDIKIVDANGEKVEIAAPVDVKIELADKEKKENPKVVHFTDSSTKGEVVRDVAVTDDTVSFPAEGFSIYAVVDDPSDNYNRMNVEFYNHNGDLIASMIVKNNDTVDDLKTILYDPGTGTVPSGTVFKGWWKGDSASYTASQADIDQAQTIEDVRDWVLNYDIPDPGDDGTIPTVKYYAMIYKRFNVTYYGNDPEISLGTHTAYALTSATSAEYTVNMAYTPDANQNFMGWKPTANTASHITPVSEDGYYPNGTAVTIDGDVVFNIEAPWGNWLVYNGNGKGATYNAPQFYLADERTEPAINATQENMKRNGYQFGGWYTDAECTEANKFEFGETLENNTEIFAKWTPVETANYTVIFWTENVDRTAYEVKHSYVGTGPVGENIPFSFVENGAEDYVEGTTSSFGTYIDPEDNNERKNVGHYTGFGLVADDANQQVEITPEGDAVINFHYKRIEYNVRFYVYRDAGSGNNRYSYANNSARGNNTWGIVDWHNSGTQHPTVDTNHLTLQHETVDGYDAYYFVLQGYYGEDISSKWPKYEWINGVNTGQYNRVPVSFVMMVGTSLKPRPSSGGDGTVKGIMTQLDRKLLGATNDPDGNFLIVRFPNNHNDWRYHIWFETVEGEDYTGKTLRTYNGKTYYEIDDSPLAVRSSNTDINQQNAPKYTGYADAFRRNQNWNGDGSWSTSNPTLYHINYVYDRLAYKIEYFDGQYVDGNGGSIQNRATHLLHESPAINHGTPIPNDVTGSGYIPSLPEGEAGYIFEGWYLDEGCTHKYTWTTMPIGGIKVYAKWRQIQYRVFLNANAGDSDSNDLSWGSSGQEMNFRVNYGEKISTPEGTRTGYEFIGWFLDPACTQVFSEDAFVLNDTTVTTDYNKNEDITDNMDKWSHIQPDSPTPSGQTGPGYNSDLYSYNEDTGAFAERDRWWITKKLELYAKWRKILVGANGIDIVYSAKDPDVETPGTNVPTDSLQYLDAAAAVAQQACTAPEGYTFDYWVVQRWDPDANNGVGAFVDTDEIAYPGDSFEVLVDNAHQEELSGHTEENPKYKYTIQLRAKYAEAEHKTPTFIPWYANNKTNASEGEGKFVVKQTNININSTQQILPANTFEYDGYTFVGWARVPISDNEGQTTPDLDLDIILDGESVDYTSLLFLEYRADGKFYSTENTVGHGVDAAGIQVKGVAPDESMPYHAMVAVWKKSYSVTVKKVVESPFASDKTNEYEFSTNIDQGTYSSQSPESFKLSHNDEKVFRGVLDGSTFSVTETVPVDMTVSIAGSYKDKDGKDVSIDVTNGGTITILGDTTITYTNRCPMASINLIKIEEGGTTDKPLPGSEFELTWKNDSGVYVENDDITSTGTITLENGTLTVEGLPSGDYKLTETKPPDGYIIMNKDIYFTVDASSQATIVISPTAGQESYTAAGVVVNGDKSDTMIIPNTPGQALPSTGGPGTRVFTILGLILILGSGLLLLMRRRMIQH